MKKSNILIRGYLNVLPTKNLKHDPYSQPFTQIQSGTRWSTWDCYFISAVIPYMAGIFFLWLCRGRCIFCIVRLSDNTDHTYKTSFRLFFLQRILQKQGQKNIPGDDTGCIDNISDRLSVFISLRVGTAWKAHQIFCIFLPEFQTHRRSRLLG